MNGVNHDSKTTKFFAGDRCQKAVLALIAAGAIMLLGLQLSKTVDLAAFAKTRAGSITLGCVGGAVGAATITYLCFLRAYHRRPKADQTVSVYTPTGIQYEFALKPTDKVKNLRQKLKTENNINHFYLYMNGTRLTDDQLISTLPNDAHISLVFLSGYSQNELVHQPREWRPEPDVRAQPPITRRNSDTPLELHPCPADGKLVECKTLAGKCFTVKILQNDTVQELKQKVHEKEGIPPDQQKLIFFGINLDDYPTHPLFAFNAKNYVRGDQGAEMIEKNEPVFHLVFRLRVQIEEN